MKVLFQRVSVLVLLLYNFSQVAKFTTAHYLYKIHSNLESVEKLTVDYANGRSGFVPGRPMKKGPADEVCRLALELKITFCWKFLTYEEYKFKFTFNMDADTLRTDCSDENIFLRILDQSQLSNSKVSMFRCPFLGEAPFLKKAVAFYFSDSHLLTSAAIVYIQETQHSAIHPYVYLDKLNLGDLKASKDLLYQTNPPPRSGKNASNELYKENRMDLDLSVEKEEVVKMLIDKMKIPETYSKFIAFYDAIDLCALSMTQKVFLCREAISSYEFDAPVNVNIDINEFTEDGCRNYELNLNNKKHNLAGFQCAPAVKYQQVKNRWWEKTYNPAAYFLLKNIFSSRISVLKLLKNGIEIDSQVKNVDLRLLKKVKQIENTVQLTKYVESDIFDPTPDYGGEKPSYQRAFPIVINRRLAEQKALEFAKIKKIESPYEKFGITFKIRNVCALRNELIVQLCEKVFTNQALWYTIEKNDEDNLKCKRQMISLVTSKVISSDESREDAFSLSLSSCPTISEKPFPVGLYLSSSPDPDSVLAYDQSYDYRNINPVTTVGPGIFDGIVDSSILMGTLSVE